MYVCIYIYSFLQKIIYAFTYTYSTVSWLRKEMYKERLPKKVPKKAAHPQKVNEDSRGFEGTDVGGTTVNNIYIYNGHLRDELAVCLYALSVKIWEAPLWSRSKP